MTYILGQVSQLFRYPIKSVGGESLQEVSVHQRGLEGDRFWAVEGQEGKFGSGKSTRRFRRMDGLLEFRAYYLPGGHTPVLVTPDALEYTATSPEATASLRERTGQQVQVTPEGDISHFDEGALHLLTTATLDLLAQRHGRPVDVRRLRNNITLATDAAPCHLEAAWVGRQLTIGAELVIEVSGLMLRCVMVNMAQAGLAEDPGVLKSIAQIHPDGCLGVVARVVQPGAIRLGDLASLT